MIETARSKAESVAEDLERHLDRGRDVVVIEPSDLAMFDSEYERLLGDNERIAEHSYELFEYVFGLLENGADAEALSAGGGERVAYHSHCQQRTLSLAAHTEAVLERLGYDVLTSDVECCGMAGSFGYKSDYYELSMDVGDRLREQFQDEDAANRTVVASGTSCLDQLDDLLERPSRHPIELVAPR
jgi:Fe-S oxidoreductase